MIIRRIEKEDIEEWKIFFRQTMEDIVSREGIDIDGFIDGEVEDKLEKIEESILETNNTFFFLGLINDQIVATISLNIVGALITELCGRDSYNNFEIGSVYVHPSMQKQGIGKLLFNFIYNELVNKNIDKFYLDSGYISSQKYWKMILGEPTVVSNNYWKVGVHHMVWHHKVNKVF